MHYNQIDLEVFLKKYSQQQVAYCANPGNAGDAIIAYSTFLLFEKIGIQPELITCTQQVENQVVFYSGGGNLVEGKYKDAYHFIKNNTAKNKEIIVLPHTVWGYDDMLLSADNLIIICREKVSYEHLFSNGFPPERLFLAPDMAFLLPRTEFDAYKKNERKGVANCFRVDAESLNGIDIPDNNIDISLSWNGELWHRPEFAKNVTHNLACYLSGFNEVRTDRLHIAILAALMGKQVHLYPNNYYKIKAVFEYSMRDSWKNVSFIDIPEDKTSIKKKSSAPQEVLEKMRVEIVLKTEYIEYLEFEKEILDGVLQSMSWKITQPLRFLSSIFRRFYSQK
jgi:exopolysaccharide biosynthesis predicted pyruvyltransferase EpsI